MPPESHPPDDRAAVARFKDFFNGIEPGMLPDLTPVYGSDIHFQDPFTEVQGLADLNRYFRNAYSNVLHCRFDFGANVGSGDQQALPWVMSLRHRKLAGGQLVRVDGMSHIAISEDRIIFHRDYFDAGQLLYENVPVLGSAVRLLRRYAA